MYTEKSKVQLVLTHLAKIQLILDSEEIMSYNILNNRTFGTKRLNKKRKKKKPE